MSTPKKKPSPKKATPAKSRSAKSKISELMKLVPNHPLAAELADPENEKREWIVEFVTPPGCFVARSIPEPVDDLAIEAEIRTAVKAMQTGQPEQNRYILFRAWSGGHARAVVEDLTRMVPNPKLPLSPNQLFNIDACFHAQ
jgi:hypothetical protein